MHLNIGVDVGNFDVKTQHTTTPSGFDRSNTKPQLTSEFLYYNGMFYIPSVNERIAYVQDKTDNDICLFLTLIGISNEILYCIREGFARRGIDYSQRNIQTELDKLTSISLGVGLPVGDLEKLKQKTQAYYEEKFKNGICHEYKGFKFSFDVRKINVFPQDLLPVAGNPKCTIPKDFSKYAIIGIGGQTVDVIPVVDGKPDPSKCISDRRGVRALFTSCVAAIEREFGITIGEDTVDDALRGKRTLLKPEMIATIQSLAQDHTNNILNYCQMNRSIRFADTPLVFFGGGALILKPYIDNFLQGYTYEFIDDVNGNARFYAEYVA